MKKVIEFLEGVGVEEPQHTKAQLMGKVNQMIYNLHCQSLDLSFLLEEHRELYARIDSDAFHSFAESIEEQAVFYFKRIGEMENQP